MTEILMRGLNELILNIDKKKSCDQSDIEPFKRLFDGNGEASLDQQLMSNKFVDHLASKLVALINSKSSEPLIAYCNIFSNEFTREICIAKFKLYVVSLISNIKTKRSNAQIEQILDYMKHTNMLLSNLIKSNNRSIVFDNAKYTEDAIVKFISLLKSTFKFEFFRKLTPYREDERVCLLILNFFTDLDVFIDIFAQLKLNQLVERSNQNVYMMAKYLRLIDKYLNFSRSLNSNETSFKIKSIMNLIRSKLYESIRIDDILNRKLESNESFSESNLIIEFYVQSIILLIKLVINVQSKAIFEDVKLNNELSLRANLERILLSVSSIRYIATKFDMIFLSQDDYLIDFNLNCLLIEIQIDENNESYVDFPNFLFKFHLNASILFIKLLIGISFDYQILIDWLITNETNFLLYFVKYLKYLCNQLVKHDLSFSSLIDNLKSNNKSLLDNFNLFLLNYNNLNSQLTINKTNKSLNSKENQPNKQLDEFEIYFWRLMETLKELNLKIKLLKSSFPYNCQPLIRLLDKLLLTINPNF